MIHLLVLGLVLLASSCAGRAEPDPPPFLRPGVTTLPEVVERLGEPVADFTAYALEGRVDPFIGASSPFGRMGLHREAREAGRSVWRVRVAEWESREPGAGRLRLVFRKDTLWYAMLPPGTEARTRDDLTGLHDGPERTVGLEDRVSDVIAVREVVVFPADCVAYVIGAARRIEAMILLPPDDCSLTPTQERAGAGPSPPTGPRPPSSTTSPTS